MRCVPSVRDEVLRLALPLPFRLTGEPMSSPSALNCTVPEVTAEPPDRTLAAKVTSSPVVEVASEEVTLVVVDAAAVSVVMVRLHPPAIEPRSPVASSTT